MNFAKDWDEGDAERLFPFVGENLTHYLARYSSRIGKYEIEYVKPEPGCFETIQAAWFRRSSKVATEYATQEELLSFDDIVNAAQH